MAAGRCESCGAEYGASHKPGCTDARYSPSALLPTRRLKIISTGTMGYDTQVVDAATGEAIAGILGVAWQSRPRERNKIVIELSCEECDVEIVPAKTPCESGVCDDG